MWSCGGLDHKGRKRDEEGYDHFMIIDGKHNVVD